MTDTSQPVRRVIEAAVGAASGASVFVLLGFVHYACGLTMTPDVRYTLPVGLVVGAITGLVERRNHRCPVAAAVVAAAWFSLLILLVIFVQERLEGNAERFLRRLREVLWYAVPNGALTGLVTAWLIRLTAGAWDRDAEEPTAE